MNMAGSSRLVAAVMEALQGLATGCARTVDGSGPIPVRTVQQVVWKRSLVSRLSSRVIQTIGMAISITTSEPFRTTTPRTVHRKFVETAGRSLGRTLPPVQ